MYEHLVNLVVAVFFTLLHSLIRCWTRNQVHSFLDLCSLYRNSRSFTASIHSLEHSTQIASRRAGLIFNSRYDLNSPRFIVLNNAPPQATACFPLSDDQRDTTVLFISTFTLCPRPSHSGTLDASSYILMFSSPFLEIHSV